MFGKTPQEDKVLLIRQHRGNVAPCLGLSKVLDTRRLILSPLTLERRLSHDGYLLLLKRFTLRHLLRVEGLSLDDSLQNEKQPQNH